MRSVLANIVFVVGLAVSVDARAQYASDPATALVDCATDSVATNLAGDAVPGTSLVAERTPQPNESHAELCQDARDPRCAPLTPLESRSSLGVSTELDRVVPALLFQLEPRRFVAPIVSSHLDPRSLKVDPLERSALERPPRDV